MPLLKLSARGLIGATGLTAFGLVAGGVVLAQTMNLAACPLCVLQRMLYLLLALESALALGIARRASAWRIAALPMLATALTGAGVAAYQTWLQRFAKGVSCTAEQPWWEHIVNWAGSQWPLLFEGLGPVFGSRLAFTRPVDRRMVADRFHRHEPGNVFGSPEAPADLIQRAVAVLPAPTFPGKHQNRISESVHAAGHTASSRHSLRCPSCEGCGCDRY